MTNAGNVSVSVFNHIGTITFSHPLSNSLPAKMTAELTGAIKSLALNKEVNVIIIRSEGNKTFCAGASLNELLEIEEIEEGKEFFMSFARLINEMRKCPKFIIARVQGKAAGGGVGIIAAADYSIALSDASVRLGELALGLGPFVIGPAIERKIGKTAFITMSIDAEWHDAFWAKQNGLFTKIFASLKELDESVSALAKKIAASNSESIAEMKKVFWEGTSDWDALLEERALISAKLALNDSTKKYIRSFKEK
jgi:methylglutaconyl-CoA hydratase